ncbi:glucokinase [Dinghuibacter silviterrae]|uniref:Glucokinase n=1 Tax=Dinghuibacter silviterrae TaxID=1539049 RepID=A0A4R8DPJ7_9BACT|nr:glucokinase [Dinghuibacter silviterrae]TDX00012.1 glucokinase [Dinghuibacter silviterrae]
MRIPIALKDTDSPGRPLVLAADLGGTKCNMALFRHQDQGPVLLRQDHFPSAQFSSMADIVRKFIGTDPMPDVICIGVAGPVLEGKSKLTNLTWDVDQQQLEQELGVGKVALINDLEATAYGLAALEDKDVLSFPGNGGTPGNIALIAPGTGLGEAGLYWDGAHYHPFATEGGHAGFGPREAIDLELFNHLHTQYEHISWERVVSGQGIMNIFHFLVEVKQRPCSEALMAAAKEDGAAAVSQAALTAGDPTAREALDMFVRYLAIESANLVLKMKGTGGLYIGGGIPVAVLPLLQSGEWLHVFHKGGRMRPLLESVDVHIVLQAKTALFGAGWYGMYNM